MSSNLQQISQFIISHPLAVLSTANRQGKCWGAALYVHVATDSDRLRLFFMTRSTALKYKNLQENDSLCLTFFNERSADILQLSGVSKELESQEKRVEILGHLSAVANERLETWAPIFQLDSGTVRLMEVIPEYARLSRFGEGKPRIFEEKFVANEA